MSTTNNNGNGWKTAAQWAMIVFALATAVFASAKDTPTRDEMERKDQIVTETAQRERDALERRYTERLARIESKLDRLLDHERDGR